ncbi:MAG: ferredoxin [Rhodoferax sp.]|nr:ferredoxin [Rhodoferax sp.]
MTTELSPAAQAAEACLAACRACADACNRCAAACLAEEHVRMMARCIALDMDCAETCALVAALIARGSVHAQAACVFCAEVCEACAEECGQHDAEHCQDCAEACRACAADCRLMAG